MGKDFTHALGLLQTFREAGLKPSTIDSVVHNSQLNEQDKNVISILNKGVIKKTSSFPSADLRTYFCYKTISEDYSREFDPNHLVPYTAQTGNISYN